MLHGAKPRPFGDPGSGRDPKRGGPENNRAAKPFDVQTAVAPGKALPGTERMKAMKTLTSTLFLAAALAAGCATAQDTPPPPPPPGGGPGGGAGGGRGDAMRQRMR